MKISGRWPKISTPPVFLRRPLMCSADQWRSIGIRPGPRQQPPKGDEAKTTISQPTTLLGHFRTLDKSINPEMVGGSQQRLRAVGKQDLLTTRWYTFGHAFANSMGGRHDQDDAALA